MREITSAVTRVDDLVRKPGGGEMSDLRGPKEWAELEQKWDRGVRSWQSNMEGRTRAQGWLPMEGVRSECRGKRAFGRVGVESTGTDPDVGV